jgi:hypothetical protein
MEMISIIILFRAVQKDLNLVYREIYERIYFNSISSFFKLFFVFLDLPFKPENLIEIKMS